MSDVFRLIGAVDAIQGVLAALIEVKRARTHRVVRAAADVRRQRTKARMLARGWGPARPFGHVADLGHTGPAQRILADRDAVPDRLALRQNVVEEARVGIDDDRPLRLLALLAHFGTGK